jgi:TonB family protein
MKMELFKFSEISAEEKQRRIFIFIVLLSLIIHILILYIVPELRWLMALGTDQLENLPPEEVTIVFPENKPKQVVENMNENDMLPEAGQLLSDRNSRAANRDFAREFSDLPFAQGNTELQNLVAPPRPQEMNDKPSNFSREALSGDIHKNKSVMNENRDKAENATAAPQQESTNNMMDQKQFSADMVGDVSLSTYAWEWAPYINQFKKKLYNVWVTPPAYHRLGLIYGDSVVRFSITRDGQITDFEVLQHTGHESLQQSSVNAINAVFPFLPLPEHFPDERLTITARLIYPNLRQRR